MGSPGGSPPRVRGGPPTGAGFDYSLGLKAIETARRALEYIVIGPPIIRRGPAGDIHVDVPLMYHGFAVDRVHYDPVAKTPSPKGRPARAWGVMVSPKEVKESMDAILGELRALDAVEYREPEEAWAVPIAWKHLLIAHIRVSYTGDEIVPDYGLTEEVRRMVG